MGSLCWFGFSVVGAVGWAVDGGAVGEVDLGVVGVAGDGGAGFVALLVVEWA